MKERYPLVFQVFHWAIAVLIIAQLSFIFLFKMFKSIEFGGLILDFHRSAGFIILLVLVARLLLAPFVKVPKSADGTPSWQKFAAHTVHGLMFLVLVAQPILGIVLASYRGDSISFLGIADIPPLMEYNPEKADQYFGLHAGLGIALIGLIGVHLGAVAFHAIFQKRNIVNRMLPAKKQTKFINKIPIWTQIFIASTILVSFTILTGLVSTSKARDAIRLQDAAFQQSLTINSMVETLGSDLNRIDGMLKNGEDAELVAEELGYLDYTFSSIAEKTSSTNVVDAIKQIQASVRDASIAIDYGDNAAINTAFKQILSDFENIKQAQVGAAFYAKNDAVKAAAEGHDFMLAALVPAVLVGVLVVFFLVQSIGSYFKEITAFANKISNGELEYHPVVIGQGEAAIALNNLIEMQTELRLAHKRTREVAENAQREASEAKASRNTIVDQMTKDFEKNVFSQIKLLGETARSVSKQSELVVTSTENSQEFTSEVSQEVQISASSINDIAAASEQLSTSISTVQSLVSNASSKATESAHSANEASRVTQELADIITNIENVVTLISEIAENTNLLALNATIEAARAGEMGKGFSVVATEVKGLADQTSKATADISQKIQQIKHASTAAVKSVEIINGLNSDVDDIAHDVDDSIKDQMDATNDIATRVETAAHGAKSIADRIEQINGISLEVGSTAEEMKNATGDMADKTELLETQARKFINSLRAAS